MAEMVTDPAKQERLAEAISEHPELLFKAAEHAIGKPRQTVEIASTEKFIWTPPARADGPISVPAHMLVFPQGAHMHEGPAGEGAIHCHLCHENWAARIDEKNECPRCALCPEERTDNGIP